MGIGVYSHTLLHPMMSLLLSCFLFSYSPTPTLVFLFICFTFLFLSSYSCSLPLLPSYYSHVHSPTLLLPCSCFCCPIAVSNPPDFLQFPSFLFSTPHSPTLLLSYFPAVLFSYFLPALLLLLFFPTPTPTPTPTHFYSLTPGFFLVLSCSYSSIPSL